MKLLKINLYEKLKMKNLKKKEKVWKTKIQLFTLY